MKKTLLFVSMVMLCLSLFYACGKKTKTTKDGYAQTADTTCGCDSSWFPHATTPPPMEGIGSPFDTNSTTNCIFHQWSFQKFLWLTRPMSNGHAFFQDSMIQVDAKMTPVAAYDTVRLVLDDTAQAGSGGSLRTNPGFSIDGQNHLVYYSIFIDPVFQDAAIAFKNTIGNDTNQLDNLYQFPVNSLEMKISWVDINAIPQAQRSSYYTTTAAVNNGHGYTVTTVAMLGMHVVGRVINHPEFIWATFEHYDMAPYYDWLNTTTMQDAPIESATDKLLFAMGSTTTMGGITWDDTTSTAQIRFKVYNLYKYGVPKSPGNVYMTGTSQSEPINYNNIDGLNQCVTAGLSTTDVWRNYFYNGSIWVNTDGLSEPQQDSLLVAQGDNIGNAVTGSVARGSLNVFNITMETYVQTLASNGVNTIHTIDSTQLFNCFICHTANTTIYLNGIKYKGRTSPLYVSHIFSNYLSEDATPTVEEAKDRGILDFMEAKQVRLLKFKK